MRSRRRGGGEGMKKQWLNERKILFFLSTNQFTSQLAPIIRGGMKLMDGERRVENKKEERIILIC